MGDGFPFLTGVTDGVLGRVSNPSLQGTRIEPRVHVLKGRPSWVRGENGPGGMGFGWGVGVSFLPEMGWEAVEYAFAAQLGEERSWQ